MASTATREDESSQQVDSDESGETKHAVHNEESRENGLRGRKSDSIHAAK